MTPLFPIGSTVRFRDNPRPAAHQCGIGTIICVPADDDGPQSYGVHHRRYDNGTYKPFTAYFEASQLEPIDTRENT